jgi:hypothetical protein
MGKSIAWLAPASVISVAALTALALDRDVSVIPHARAQDLNVTDQEALCPRGDATLLGTYMAIGGGTVVGFGPVAFVGKLTYHGDGHITKVSTVSFAGEISTSADTPTYTVHSDCTGTHTSGDGTQHYNFVVSPEGSKLVFVETDATTAITGTITRLRD